LAQQQVASSVTGAGATLGPLNIKAPKNGYVFIYVSNGSDQDVYFDNLNVAIAAAILLKKTITMRMVEDSSNQQQETWDSYEGL